MKNKLSDLNNHLFEELERLNDEELKGEFLKEEIGRAKAIASISEKIIANGNLVLNAIKEKREMGEDIKDMPRLFLGDTNGK